AAVPPQPPLFASRASRGLACLGDRPAPQTPRLAPRASLSLARSSGLADKARHECGRDTRGAEAGGVSRPRTPLAARRAGAHRGLHDPAPAVHEVPRRLLRLPRRQGRSGDGSSAALARCHGLDTVGAETVFRGDDAAPALAFWVAAVRELLEESGILLVCEGHGRPLDAREAAVAVRIERCRKALMAAEAPFAELLAREGWYCDLGGLRYLSHFITPRSSPIRFSARFF